MRHLILDTDFCSDCDDAVAVRLLANLHLRKVISLDGVVIDSVIPGSAPALGALMRLCGIEEIPVGVDASGERLDTASRYHAGLLKRPSRFADNADAENGVALYRRLLAAADEKIDIVGVGFEHVVADLLKSEGDESSPLSGAELVKQKCGGLWLMAGRWNQARGTEFNVAHTPFTAAAAAYIAEYCPVPIIYSGWEIGVSVISGARLPKDHALHEIMADYNGRNYDGSNKGRCSFDPMTALLAAVGDIRQAGYDAVYGRAVIDPVSGENEFIRDANGKDCYVTKRLPDAYYARMIDELIR